MKRRKRGFTLVEMLAAVLILTLLTGAIAAGTMTSAKVYTGSVFTSESGILASTVNTALGDVLRYARTDGEAAENGTVLFTNVNYGVTDGYLLTLDDGRIYIAKNRTADSTDASELLILVSDGTYTSLKVGDLAVEYEAGVFTGSYTITNREGTLSREVRFTTRAVNAG